jgi:TnpA family transposase
MLQVGLSIAAGTITPSRILRRLGTYSRKNRPYLAFRELGVAVRTGFLLQYLGDAELRSIIQAATLAHAVVAVVKVRTGCLTTCSCDPFDL